LKNFDKMYSKKTGRSSREKGEKVQRYLEKFHPMIPIDIASPSRNYMEL
jgi:hypothetical protein